MNDNPYVSESWRSSTSMILWGIVALSVFGCVASFCEFFFGVLDTAKGYLDSLFNVALSTNDQTHAEGFFKFYAVHGRLPIWTRVSEVITIGGWIAYVVGLSKFRHAQASDKGRWLAGGLYSACWLGLVGMACAFVGSFLGMFGMLFRFAGWVLDLISLFKFRNAFNQLRIEESWDSLARKGAGTLRTSYTFGIILAFFPIIVFLVAVFIILGSVSNLSGFISGMGSDGINTLVSVIGGAAIIFILLALAEMLLWIFQVCYLIGGWCKINNGSIADGEEHEHRNYSTGLIIGSILSALVLMGMVTWTCSAPIMTKEGSYHIGPSEQTTGYADEVSEILDNKATQLSQENPTEAEITDDESAPDGMEDDDIQSIYEFVNYKGLIDGKYAIEMIIDFDTFSGSYYYTKNKQPIELRGEMDGDHLVLKEYVGNKMTGIFDGTQSGTSYRGTWSSADGSRTYPFEVTEY